MIQENYRILIIRSPMLTVLVIKKFMQSLSPSLRYQLLLSTWHVFVGSFGLRADGVVIGHVDEYSLVHLTGRPTQRESITHPNQNCDGLCKMIMFCSTLIK